MSYNTKNYTEQGGEVTHFGGKVIFEEGCEVEGGSFTEVHTASTDTKGVVKVGDGLSVTEEGELSVAEASKTVAGGVLAVDDLEDCAATDVAGINAFLNNYLLGRLRTAGILVGEEE